MQSAVSINCANAFIQRGSIHSDASHRPRGLQQLSLVTSESSSSSSTIEPPPRPAQSLSSAFHIAHMPHCFGTPSEHYYCFLFASSRACRINLGYVDRRRRLAITNPGAAARRPHAGRRGGPDHPWWHWRAVRVGMWSRHGPTRATTSAVAAAALVPCQAAAAVSARTQSERLKLKIWRQTEVSFSTEPDWYVCTILHGN